jgi:hypothetical protein
MSVQNYYRTFHDSFKLIRTKYNPPESINQTLTYIKAIKQLDSYKPTLRSYMSQAVMRGSIDIGLRLAVFRYFTGGLYQSTDSVNVEYWRRVFPTALGAALTSWLLVPFETSRAAFLGDKSFPVELRKGYTSQSNALFKMVTKEPFALWKNSLPTMGGSYIQTSFAFCLFDFSFDFFGILFREFGIPKFMVKTVTDFSSTLLSLAFAYPIHVTVRKMIETSPEQISKGIYHKNYRKAFWALWNYEGGSTAWVGFSKYCHKNFIWMFLMIWYAESFGFFKSWRTDYTDWPGTNETKIFMI